MLKQQQQLQLQQQQQQQQQQQKQQHNACVLVPGYDEMFLGWFQNLIRIKKKNPVWAVLWWLWGI